MQRELPDLTVGGWHREDCILAPEMSNSDPIRVLALLEAEYVTGAAKAVLEFAREAAASRLSFPRYTVTVVNFSRGLKPDDTSLSLTMRTLGVPYETVFERHAFDFEVVPQLVTLVRKLRPNLIWSNSIKSHFLVRWAGLAREIAWVAYHHGYTATDSKMLFYNQLDRWSLKGADRVITVCKPSASELIAKGVRPESIRIQGMPIRRFEPLSDQSIDKLRNQLGIMDGAVVLLNVGRLSREKGHADLLLAFRKLCNSDHGAIRLVVVGDGPEQDKLNKLVQELGLIQKVRLVGRQDDVRPYYALADIFVLPSHSEGTPNVLLEAMAMGVPVVATSVGGVPELTDGGVAALLTRKRDIDGLADAVARLIREPDLQAKLISAGREVVEKNTSERYFRTLALVFREAMDRTA
jgi:glycosyltransferase involved in cell wall biosynthesis